MSRGRRSPLGLLAAAAAFALAGCGQIETHRVAFSPGQRPEGAAELFVGTLPPRPYAELGLVEAAGYGTDAEPDAVLKALQREGRRMGCDAVVKVRVETGNTAAHAVGVCVGWTGG